MRKKSPQKENAAAAQNSASNSASSSAVKTGGKAQCKRKLTLSTNDQSREYESDESDEFDDEESSNGNSDVDSPEEIDSGNCLEETESPLVDKSAVGRKRKLRKSADSKVSDLVSFFHFFCLASTFCVEVPLSNPNV